VADVLNYPGLGANGGVPAPYLQNTLLAASGGLGETIALGMGRMTRRFGDIVSTEGGVSINEVQLQQMIVAAAQSGGSAAQAINYNFEGMIGPPGPPGQTIVQYLRAPVGLGQTGVYGEDGADAFDDIDIPIPYDGFEGAFTNNSPGAGSVAWTSFKLKYKGTAYTITATNTANAYLYWDVTAPTVLSSTATRANAVGSGKFLVGHNDSGTFYPSQFAKLLTAGWISVNQLSALAADLGTVTAGVLTMNLGSTYRLRLSPNGLQGSINSGSSYFDIIDLDGTDVVIQGTKLKLLSVDTGVVAANAITGFDSATSASGNWAGGASSTVTLASYTIATGYVRVTGQVEVSVTDWVGDTAVVTLLRDATPIRSVSVAMAAGTRTAIAINDIDNPGAGTYDYKINITATGAGEYWNADVSAENVKK